MTNLPVAQENIANDFIFYFWCYAKNPKNPELPFDTWHIDMPIARGRWNKLVYIFTPEMNFILREEKLVFSDVHGKGFNEAHGRGVLGDQFKEMIIAIRQNPKIPFRYKPIITRDNGPYRGVVPTTKVLFKVTMPYQIISLMEQTFTEYSHMGRYARLLKRFISKSGIPFEEAVEELYQRMKPLLQKEGFKYK